MKTLGLLGGMTYHATLLYYEQINARVQARLGGTHSARLILQSYDHQELGVLINSNQWDKVADILVQGALGLKSLGAEGILLCVNTMHKVADRIESATGLPFLHIIDFTGRAIVQHGQIKTVGLLGTRPVMEEDFIKGRLRDRFDLNVLTPSDAGQRKRISDVIFSDLGKMLVTEQTKILFQDAVADLVSQGAQGIILGCTELRFVLKQDEVAVPLFDTVDLHATGVADWALEA